MILHFLNTILLNHIHEPMSNVNDLFREFIEQPTQLKGPGSLFAVLAIPNKHAGS